MKSVKDEAKRFEDHYNSLSEFDKKSRYAWHLRRREGMSDEEYVKQVKTGHNLIGLLCGVSLGAVNKDNIDDYLKEIFKDDPGLLELVNFTREQITNMKIEELSKIVKLFSAETESEFSRVLKEEEKIIGPEEALYILPTMKKMLDFIKALIDEPNDEDPDSLTVAVNPESKVATIRTPGRYKDQDTTLIVRISEVPEPTPGKFKSDFKIEYLHTEGTEEVLQQTFFCCRPFWYLVQHEQDKLKRFKETLKRLKGDNPETNHLDWSNRL